MRIHHGSYLGTGSTLSISGLAFQPDLVWIRRVGYTDVGSVPLYYRNSSMPAGLSCTWRSDASYESGLILSLDASGFTLGTNAYVNYSGDTYYYTMFSETGVKDFKTGVFTGTGSTLSINIGFRPDYVGGHTNYSQVGAHRFSCTSTSSGRLTHQYWQATNLGGVIVSLDNSGFTLDSSTQLNRSGVETSYWAFKESPGRICVQEYIGTGSSGRILALKDPSITPKFVLIKGDNSTNGVMKMKQNTDVNVQEWVNSVPWNNCITQVSTGSIMLGDDTRTNQSGTAYSLLAIADNIYSDDYILPNALSAMYGRIT